MANNLTEAERIRIKKSAIEAMGRIMNDTCVIVGCLGELGIEYKNSTKKWQEIKDTVEISVLGSPVNLLKGVIIKRGKHEQG